ncbi:hypothetical protein BJY04DRAFT_224760 [Aspergillus karnatakaensis]|uniref:uncharacterized protein n=1 Tax=Aspergillus karnatakaensis TaxID=1810916 RepID=UPI003CCD73A7
MTTHFDADFGLPSAGSDHAVNFDDLCDLDAAAFDSAIDIDLDLDLDFSDPSTTTLFDWKLPDVGNCTPGAGAGTGTTTADTTFQWPMSMGMLTPQSLPPPPSTASISTASSTHPSASEASPAKQNNNSNSNNTTKQRARRSTIKKGDRASKAKAAQQQRPHYAVEKRYRSSLNEKYAALTQALLAESTQRICRTEAEDWTLELEGGNKEEQNSGTGVRQSKTATLSATIEAIDILTRCCEREAKEVERLRTSVGSITQHVRQLLEANTTTTGSPGRASTRNND